MSKSKKSKKTIAPKTLKAAVSEVETAKNLMALMPAPAIRTARHPFLPHDPVRVFVYRCDGLHHVAVELLVDLPAGWQRAIHVESHYDAGIASTEAVRWAVDHDLDVVEP